MDQVVEGVSKDLLSNYLNDKGYLVSTFGFYGEGFRFSRQKHLSTIAKSMDVTMLMNFTIIRTLTGRLAYSGDLLEELESSLEFDSYPAEENSLLDKIAKANSPDWDKRFSAEFVDLENYLHRLKVGTSQPVVHFLENTA